MMKELDILDTYLGQAIFNRCVDSQMFLRNWLGMIARELVPGCLIYLSQGVQDRIGLKQLDQGWEEGGEKYTRSLRDALNLLAAGLTTGEFIIFEPQRSENKSYWVGSLDELE